MARPTKIGLDYFPLDVDFFDDEKVMAISKEFGIKGEIVVIRLLCAIYRNGYFILWNDLLRNKLMMDMPGISSELLEQIVQRLVKWGFFDKTLFDSVEKVLTSTGIQKRYVSASRKRKVVTEIPKYWLLGDDSKVSVADNTVSSAQNPVSSANNTQSKVKESKVTTTTLNACEKISKEDDFFNALQKDTIFLESAAMRYGTTTDDVLSALAKLQLENKATTKDHTDFNDYRRHAFNWMRYYYQDKAKEKQNEANPTNRQNKRRGTEITAVSAEDYKGSF